MDSRTSIERRIRHSVPAPPQPTPCRRASLDRRCLPAAQGELARANLGSPSWVPEVDVLTDVNIETRRGVKAIERGLLATARRRLTYCYRLPLLASSGPGRIALSPSRCCCERSRSCLASSTDFPSASATSSADGCAALGNPCPAARALWASSVLMGDGRGSILDGGLGSTVGVSRSAEEAVPAATHTEPSTASGAAAAAAKRCLLVSLYMI